jgi:hypothetical protein
MHDWSLALNRISILSLCFLAAFTHNAIAQAGIGAGSPPPPVAVQSVPEHPVTEATLRRYFEVCHFSAYFRESLELQSETQQATLPSWYPPEVWTDIVQTIGQLDVAAIALPVYQKYFSEEATQNATRLFLTPAGQATISKVYAKTLKGEASGDSAIDARRKALEAERATEDADVRKMLGSMTPKEERDVQAFVQSAEWKRMNGLSGQVFKEFSAALQARVGEVMHEVTVKHTDELRKALRDYKAEHPGYEVPKATAN